MTHADAAVETQDHELNGYDLTPSQRRVWSLEQIGNSAVAGRPLLELGLSGPLDVTTLRTALDRLALRHPALRLRFRVHPGGRVLQLPDNAAALPLSVCDLSAQTGGDTAHAYQRIRNELAVPDIESGVPAGAALVRLSAHEARLLIVLHPIICDSASLDILADSFALLYADAEAGSAGLSLAGAPLAWLERPEASAEALSRWETRLADDHADATLPLAWRRETRVDGARSAQLLTLGTAEADAARAAAAACGTSLALFLSAAFGVLLTRYSGQARLKYGVALDAPLGGERREIGRVADVLPLLLDLSSGLSFKDALGRVAEALEAARSHYVPFETLAQTFWVNNEDNGRGFLPSVHMHRPLPPAVVTTPGGLRITAIAQPPLPLDADFLFISRDLPDGGIELVLDHPRGQFDPRLVGRALTHLARIIGAASAGPEKSLRDIQLVSPAELEALSRPYPDGARDDPRPVHALIAGHVPRAPDTPAVFFGDAVWTRAALDHYANRIANMLLAAGARRESCVAVALRRSPEAIGAILGVLKAGAAFIPVEPDHPAQRNDHILADAGVAVILTTRALRAKLRPAQGTTVIELDAMNLAEVPDSDPLATISDRQLAYVIYTSGSTGKPKGVAVEHGPLTRHLQATARVYEMDETSRELPFLPFSSDGGHERWMVPLMLGGSIVLPDKPLWTPEETFAAMRRHGVNNASFPTTYVQQLAEWAEATGEAPPVRLYSFGGEGMAQATFDLFSRALKAQTLINGYGPTETIMTPMVWKVRSGTSFEGMYAPIGRAVGLRRIYVLDPDLNPVPIGVTGELYIGGDGVARGYVNRPGATAERFIPDPFGADGGRLYASGDLARWREDGTVEFVGRVDHQVKLRGYRIEPGEIEAALRTLPGVSECAVVLRHDAGQPALVAYAVPARGARLDGAEVRRALAGLLPEHMVPSAVVVLEKMPLNANSKLDRAALPAPGFALLEVVPPSTPLEADICAMWCDTLGLPEVGVTQNFFEMGGNSMAALRILGRIRKLKPEADVAIADLFNHQTIRDLATAIERGPRPGGGQLIHLRSTGRRPMLYCFPGLLVSTREYVKLVDHLGPDQPATGFICYSLAEDKGREASVTEITARYAELVRTHSKGEPCFFLGWSWGGLLAYEAARMLGSDIDLKLIGMIDVCDMDTDFAIGAIPRFAPGEREALAARVEAWLARTAMAARWRDLIGAMDALAYDQFLRFVGNSPEGLPEDGPDIGSREHTFWVLIDNALIFRRHKMLPHDCPIQPWAAADSLNRGLNLIDWRQLSRRAAPAEIIEGTTHLHIIGAPAFHARFARKLDEAMTGFEQAAE
ncbi:amino acid adenylation domain-containing protein [Azorhizobium sp. AG788]|uniref:non-ribosomal peptide synthetase n=1 Tax=Azorhizobium sp. AG788 TaxID=2183897 RepID=UPI00105BED7C|nr:non-ribosomal peptide synthetase [Azorhizobium sp. AG788]TDT93701.1 amino acid adenylation domain-containing protein [Azorhizobium sp. AG788]